MSYFVGASICVLWLFPLDMLKNWEYLEKVSPDVPVDIPWSSPWKPGGLPPTQGCPMP